MRILGGLLLRARDMVVVFAPFYNHQMQRREKNLMHTMSPSRATMRLTKKVLGAMGELMQSQPCGEGVRISACLSETISPGLHL